MTVPLPCPRCGAEFVPGPGLKELCPRCLMQAALADSDPADAAGSGASALSAAVSATADPLSLADARSGSRAAVSAVMGRPARRPKRSGFRYQAGDRPLEGYTILAPLGHGGFGEVYHAQSDGGKEVALKLVERFLEVELRGVGHCLNLKHPQLVALYDVRPDGEERVWIVMEYVAGETLAEVLDRHPEGLPTDEALRWLEGTAAAVEHLHEAGIVHRDLKPGNVFDDAGTVKVGDYGLSKFITASRRSGQTQSIGTLHYMAPEIGTGRYGCEVDVYAVGVMLYEMLTGRVPFDGESPAEIIVKHLNASPDLAPLPPALRGIVGRMLAKHPQDRYGSLAAVLADAKARVTGALADAGPLPAEPSAWLDTGPSAWLESPLQLLHEKAPAGSRLRAWFARALHEEPGQTCGALWLTLIVLGGLVGGAALLLHDDPQASVRFSAFASFWFVLSTLSVLALYSWAALIRNTSQTAGEGLPQGRPGVPRHPTGILREGSPALPWQSGRSVLLDEGLLEEDQPQDEEAAAEARESAPRSDSAAMVESLRRGRRPSRKPATRPGRGAAPAPHPLRRERGSWGALIRAAILLCLLVPLVACVGWLLAGFAGAAVPASIALLVLGVLAWSVFGLIQGSWQRSHDLQAARSSPGRKPGLAWTAGRLLASVFWGVAIGLLTGGALLALQGGRTLPAGEVASLLGAGTGCIAASVLAARGPAHRAAGAPVLRLFVALLRGAGVGLLTSGAVVATWPFAWGFHDPAVWLGTGAGSLTVGVVCLRWPARNCGWLPVRAGAGLLSGIGASLITAVLLSVAHPPSLWRDEALVLAAAVGFSTAGTLLVRIAMCTVGHAWLRVLAAMVLGVGTGLLAAWATMNLTGQGETAALLGLATGLLTCGTVAYRLFVPDILQR